MATAGDTVLAVVTHARWPRLCRLKRASFMMLTLVLLLAFGPQPAHARAHQVWKKHWVRKPDQGPDHLRTALVIAAYIPLSREEASRNTPGTPEIHGHWDTWQLHKLWLESQCATARQAHGQDRPVQCVALVPQETSTPEDDWSVTTLRNQVRDNGRSTRAIWTPTETFRCTNVHPRARNAHRFRCYAQFLRSTARASDIAYAVAFVDTSAAMFYDVTSLYDDTPEDWSVAFVARPEVGQQGEHRLLPTLEALAPIDSRLIFTNVGRALHAAEVFDELDAIVENDVMEDCRVAPRARWTSDNEEAAQLAEREDAVNNFTRIRDPIVEADLAWSADSLALGVMAKEVGQQSRLLPASSSAEKRRESLFGKLGRRRQLRADADAYPNPKKETSDDSSFRHISACRLFIERLESDTEAPLSSEAHPGAEVARAAAASGPREEDRKVLELPDERMFGVPYTWKHGSSRTHQIRVLPGLIWSAPPRLAYSLTKVIQLRNSVYNASEIAECRRVDNGGVLRCFDAHEADLQRIWRTEYVEDRKIALAYSVENYDCCYAGGEHYPLRSHIHTFWAHHINRLERYDCLMEKREQRVSKTIIFTGRWLMKPCPGGHMYEKVKGAWVAFAWKLEHLQWEDQKARKSKVRFKNHSRRMQSRKGFSDSKQER